MNLVLMALSFLLLLPTGAGATPIKPDIRKILENPTPPPPAFVPARAGWNGPEIPVRIESVNSTFDQLGPAATARQVHQAVFAAFFPDYRALGAVILIIMLLRRITTHRRSTLAAATANGVTAQFPVASNIEDTPRQKAA